MEGEIGLIEAPTEFLTSTLIWYGYIIHKEFLKIFKK